jgi:hypothetical protein
MFVPELGQCDSRTHKNLSLADLAFRSPLEYGYEFKMEAARRARPRRRWIRSMFFAPPAAQTIGGLLFLPAQR